MEQKNVGLWIRVSTEFQVKDDSPEHHRKRGMLYAEAKNWNVKEVYNLEAVSGKSVMDHPEAKRMLRDIRNGHITGLIFSKLARLARNTKELLEFAEIFRECNADLVSLSENIDTSSPAGRLFYTMIAAMAEWERAEIADRVAASVPIRARMGKPLGGQAAFGYTWDGKEYIVNEAEAPIRKKMYELFLEHKRKGTVAQKLNKLGHRTRNGSQFTDTTIGRLLQDPTAKGHRRANYTKSLGEGKNWVIKPESEWIITPCPAIITEELWDDCNHILAEQERKNKRPTKKVVHLFTGILFCGCGNKMLIPSNSKKYICNACKQNRIEAIDLEEIYFEQLRSFLLTDEQIKSFLKKANTTITEKEIELNHLNETSKKLQNEMDKLISLHLSGELPKEDFGKYFRPYKEQQAQVQSSIPELQVQIDFLKVEHLNGDHILYEAKNLYNSWPLLDGDAKRNIVEQITESITMDGEDITIKFNYSPPATPSNPLDSQMAPNPNASMSMWLL